MSTPSITISTQITEEAYAWLAEEARWTFRDIRVHPGLQGNDAATDEERVQRLIYRVMSRLIVQSRMRFRNRAAIVQVQQETAAMQLAVDLTKPAHVTDTPPEPQPPTPVRDPGLEGAIGSDDTHADIAPPSIAPEGPRVEMPAEDLTPAIPPT